MLIIRDITNNNMYIVQELHTLYDSLTNSYTHPCKQTCG